MTMITTRARTDDTDEIVFEDEHPEGAEDVSEDDENEELDDYEE